MRTSLASRMQKLKETAPLLKLRSTLYCNNWSERLTKVATNGDQTVATKFIVRTSKSSLVQLEGTMEGMFFFRHVDALL